MSALLVRNTRPGPTTLTPVEGSSEYLVWQGAGDPEGQDVQLVSEEAAKTLPFQRAVARQLLVVEGDELPQDPMVQAYLERQHALAEAKRLKAEAEIENGIDRAEQRVLHGLECVGPDTRGIGVCGTLVSVSGKSKDQVPPLCERHKHLALEYVAEVSEKDDKQVTTWSRMLMGPREKAVRA